MERLQRAREAAEGEAAERGELLGAALDRVPPRPTIFPTAPPTVAAQGGDPSPLLGPPFVSLAGISAPYH